MQIQWVNKDTHLLYISLFIPLPFHCKNLHSLEHRFFLDKDLLSLERESVDFNGASLRNGILLKFVIHKNQYHKLLSILEKILKWPLPKWNQWEKERFKKELKEEKEDTYTFYKLKNFWYREFYKMNKITEKLSIEDGLWRKYMNFNNIRCHIIWNVPDKSFSNPWKINELNYTLPVISNEYSDKNTSNTITIFTPNYIQSDLNMYFVGKIYNIMLSRFLQKRYLDTGCIYDYDGYIWSDNGLTLHGTHLENIKNPIHINDIKFKIPTVKEFIKLKNQYIGELQYSYDMMEYQNYAVLWFTPEEEFEKLKKFNHGDLSKNWNKYLSNISLIYW